MNLFKVNGKIEPCCAEPKNLVVTSVRRVTGQALGRESGGQATIRVCKVCGRKHHELSVDPVHFGIKGSGVGLGK